MANIINKDLQQNNGFFIPITTVFVPNGETSSISGSSTGSIDLSIGSNGIRLKRIEIFHSGSAEKFNISLETNYFNSGSYDPRNQITYYNEISGSDNYSKGIDQIEDMISIINGKIILKIMPYGSRK